jgi:hypothetical protein
MKHRVWLLGVLMAAASAAPAYAQGAGKIGLEMSTGNTLGLVWQVSDNVAIRPEFAFNKSSTDSTTGSTTITTDANGIGASGSVLFYTSKHDALRTYLTPRFDFIRSKSTTGSTERTSKAYSLSGSFGAQYGLGDRFQVFGEFGLQAGWAPEQTIGTTTTKSSGFGTRSAVGVAFIF